MHAGLNRLPRPEYLKLSHREKGGSIAAPYCIGAALGLFIFLWKPAAREKQLPSI
jgi:hypothetical protein